MTKWLETYKSSSLNSFYKNGKYYVTQYFSEGYQDSENEWIEGDYAVDTESDSYEDAVDEGYNKFLADIGEGTIIDYNRSHKQLPDSSVLIDDEDNE